MTIKLLLSNVFVYNLIDPMKYEVTQDKSLKGRHVQKGLCARVSIWDHRNFFW